MFTNNFLTKILNIKKKNCRWHTLRSWLNEISALIRTFSPYWITMIHWSEVWKNFPGITHMTAFLENCQKSNTMYCFFLQFRGEGPLKYKIQGTNLFPTFIKNKDLLPWIWEQRYIVMYIWKFSRCVDIPVNPGKLLEIHFYASLFSNPGEKVLIIVSVPYSQDLRVWHT